MIRKILLVDDSPVRQPFLSEFLNDSGKVMPFQVTEKAIEAVSGGLPVDVAVVHYRRRSTPLIRAIRSHCPAVRIVAFGGRRQFPPDGVDAYLNKPILAADIRAIVEDDTARRRARG